MSYYQSYPAEQNNGLAGLVCWQGSEIAALALGLTGAYIMTSGKNLFGGNASPLIGAAELAVAGILVIGKYVLKVCG
jgi:hypothetical protein